MNLQHRLQTIQQQIHNACQRANRDPQTITLIAVTKNQPPTTIQQAAQLGIRHFGENKIQELKTKTTQTPNHLHWHFIGHLQTNKCRDAIHHAQTIHSIDTQHLAQALQTTAQKQAATIPILLQTNIAGDAAKYGFTPQQLLDQLHTINQYDRLEIHGLMTILPWTKNPQQTRPHYQKLQQLRQQAQQKLGAPLPHLSMGMSSDYPIAIEEGATHIRIGTALFGPRPQPQKKPTQ